MIKAFSFLLTVFVAAVNGNTLVITGTGKFKISGEVSRKTDQTSVFLSTCNQALLYFKNIDGELKLGCPGLQDDDLVELENMKMKLTPNIRLKDKSVKIKDVDFNLPPIIKLGALIGAQVGFKTVTQFSDQNKVIPSLGLILQGTEVENSICFQKTAFASNQITMTGDYQFTQDILIAEGLEDAKVNKIGKLATMKKQMFAAQFVQETVGENEEASSIDVLTISFVGNLNRLVV